MSEAISDLDLLELLLEDEGEGARPGTRLRPRPDPDRAPLSYQQQRLWFLHELDPASTSFNVSGAVALFGHLDWAALQEAIDALVQRHESLRTGFEAPGGAPWQRIAAHGHVPLEVQELADHEDAAILDHIARETARPFDLARPPLLRARLLRCGEQHHVLVFTIHHIVCDGWSIGIFLAELAALYHDLSRGAAPALPPLPVQYGDYACWQKDILGHDGFAAELAHWQRKLADLPAIWLPWSRPRRAHAAPITGGSVARVVSAATTARLRRLVKAQDATLAIGMMAAFQTLLYRYGGQRDFPIGLAHASRDLPEIAGLIGFFVNMLVIRADLSGAPRFSDVVGRARDAMLEAMDHGQVPFEMLVDRLRPERHPNRHPLFQVSFVFQNLPRRDFELPGLTLERLGDDQTARFDLEIFLTESDAGLGVNWVYDAHLFDREVIEGMADAYGCLLDQVAADPLIDIDAIRLIDEERGLALLRAGEQARQVHAVERCLHQVFARTAARHPQRTALVQGERRWRYHEIDAVTSQMAHYLIAQGVTPGSFVALYQQRSADTLLAILAILKAGAAYVPIDPMYPPERVQLILADSKAPWVIADAALGARLEPGAACRVLDLHAADWQAYPASSPAVEVTPDAIAYIIYTSGSTGTPKGCLITHRNVVRLMRATEAWFGFHERDVWTLFHSYAFDFSVWEMWGAWFYGGRLVLVPHELSRDTEAFYDLLCTQRVTVLCQTPSAFQALIEMDRESRRDAELSLRYVIFGGEALDLCSLRPWLERHGDERPRLVNMYGITETTVHVTYRPITLEDVLAQRGSVIGVPIPDLSIHILDSRKNPVPPGAVGEIYVGGAGVAAGYLDRDELTRQRFVQSPVALPGEPEARWYRSGDLGRRLGAHDIEYRGRADEQVKIRGFRIEIGEIRARIQGVPGVRDSLITLDSRGEERRLLAHVIPDRAYLSSRERLRELARTQVSEWQETFDSTYAQDNPTGIEGFNTAGWLQSYTGEQIPDHQMRAWLDDTLAALRGLRARRVLEIGCGTGMLLLDLAPAAEAYVGLDFSATTIEQLQGIVRRRGLDHVELHQRAADELDLFAGRQFDAIVLNSVVQYFPDSDYLMRVLRACAQLLAPGGTLFVGDVRNLALLEAYHASVAWQRAGRDTPRAEIAARVAQAVMLEEELLLDPAFFTALPAQLPEIDHAVVSARPGGYVNELDKYRYDVFLCREPVSGLERLRREPDPAVLAALDQDAVLLDWLRGDRPGERAGDLELAREPRGQEPGLTPVHSAGKPPCNQPAVAQAIRKLPATIRAHLGRLLPDYMIPAHIMVLEAFPLTVHGKIDVKALPRPLASSAGAQSRFAAPRPGGETALAELWREVLNIERVGRDDDFFALGGHSLLATQLIARIGRRFGASLPLRTIFEHPTLAALAQRLAEAKGSEPAPERIPRIERTAAPPLSFAQQRLWFLEQLHPGQSTYNTYQAVQIHGPLDLDVLQRALDLIIERHEILRTSIPLVEDAPVQIIHAAARCPIARRPAAYDADHQPSAALVQSILADANQPFALDRAPLLRAIVYTQASVHTVVLIAHHIIIDGWSLGVLTHELNTCYRALRRGEAPALPPLPIQYADYAAWQQQWIHGEEAHAQRDAWLRALADPPEPCTLPHDAHLDARDLRAGALLTRGLGRDATAALSRLCVQHQATPYMVLLAALCTLLHRVTSRDDIVVGSPIAQRNHPELEPLIGFFVNTLALRARPRAGHTFAALLAEVRETVLGAYGRQSYPFERLVEELLRDRDGARNPLFEIMLVVQNQPMEALDWDGLPCRTLDIPGVTAKLDLTLFAGFAGAAADSELVITAEYRTACYREHTIAAYLDALQRILEHAAASPDLPLACLPLTAPTAPTPAPAAPASSLLQLFARTAQRHPDAAAVEYQGQQLTYATLDEQSDRVARTLQAQGVRAEQPVGVLMDPGLHVLSIFLGILKAGAVYLPLDPQHPDRRLAQIIDDARPALILTGDDTPAAAQGRAPIWTAQELSARMQAVDPAGAPLPAVRAEQLAYIIYTSGSTGVPKGVMVAHAGMANLALTEIRHYGTRHGDRVLLAANLTFDASISEIINVLVSGATLVMMPRASMIPDHAFVTALRALAITWWTIRPSFLAVLTDRDLPDLRTLILAGERLEREIVRPWLAPGRRIFNAYGPTEATVCASCEPITADALAPDAAELAIGQPLDNVRMYVLDAWLNPLPDGVIGEIYIGGVGVSRGYLGQPAMTAERFVPDPLSGLSGARMYRTGDLGKRRADGKILCLGRADFQIKLRGYRIDPGEIEACLRQVHGVRDAVVTLWQDPHTGAALVAHVAAEPASMSATTEAASDPASFSAAGELEARAHAHLREHLPAHMIPRHIVIMDALPLSASGKLDRRALPAPDPDRPPGQTHAGQAPRTALEWRLRLIFERVLARAPVAMDQGFFDLGGHSFLAVRLAAELERELGTPVPVSLVFTHPTVRALAAALCADDPVAARAGRVPLRERGERAPLFLVHQAGGYVHAYFPLVSHIDRAWPVIGLQPPGLDGRGEPLDSIPALAQHHIQQLRAMQPRGPYHLAGHSLGGIIAYEMAQQLTRAGDAVAYLGLIDCHLPGAAGAHDEPVDPRGAFRFVIEQIQAAYGQPLDVILDPQGSDEAWLAQTARALCRAGMAGDEDVAQRYVSGLHRVFLASVRAYRDYQASPHAGDAHVYQTPALAQILADRPALAWPRWITGRAHVHAIPGEHLDALQEPHVAALGDAMNAHLGALQPEDHSA